MASRAGDRHPCPQAHADHSGRSSTADRLRCDQGAERAARHEQNHQRTPEQQRGQLPRRGQGEDDQPHHPEQGVGDGGRYSSQDQEPVPAQVTDSGGQLPMPPAPDRRACAQAWHAQCQHHAHRGQQDVDEHGQGVREAEQGPAQRVTGQHGGVGASLVAPGSLGQVHARHEVGHDRGRRGFVHARTYRVDGGRGGEPPQRRTPHHDGPGQGEDTEDAHTVAGGHDHPRVVAVDQQPDRYVHQGARGHPRRGDPPGRHGRAAQVQC